jgi:hypothetical protein
MPIPSAPRARLHLPTVHEPHPLSPPPVNPRFHAGGPFVFKFRQILLYCVLQFAVLIGMPMKPEEIRELLNNLNKPQIVRTVHKERN